MSEHDMHGGYGRCNGMLAVWVDDGERSNFYRHGTCPDCAPKPPEDWQSRALSAEAENEALTQELWKERADALRHHHKLCDERDTLKALNAELIRERDEARARTVQAGVENGWMKAALTREGHAYEDSLEREDGWQQRCDALQAELDALRLRAVPADKLNALREDVARVIDPGAWRVMDGYLAEMQLKYRGQDCGFDPDAFKHKASLAKADAIIALFRQEEEGVRQTNGAKQCADPQAVQPTGSVSGAGGEP